MDRRVLLCARPRPGEAVGNRVGDRLLIAMQSAASTAAFEAVAWVALTQQNRPQVEGAEMNCRALVGTISEFHGPRSRGCKEAMVCSGPSRQPWAGTQGLGKVAAVEQERKMGLHI